MNLNGNDNQEPKIPIICPKCQQRFSALIPQPEIINGPRVSVVTAAHAEPIRCVCGQQFALGITEAQVGWGWQPIETEQSRIIVPQLKLANK